MRKSLMLCAIILPFILGIATIVASQKIIAHFAAKPPAAQVARARSPLPQAPLINLSTNHDDYQNVIKGRVLLLFITTDCDACRKELSNASQIAAGISSTVTIYGVGIEDKESVRTFIEANHVDLPILLDYRAAILGRLGFKLMPTKVLLQDGMITRIWYGSSPDKSVLIKDVVAAEAR